MLVAAALSAAVAFSATPEFKIGSVHNPTAVHIQRTMKALEESTAAKPATVRVLFYGQSIVAQGWTKVLMKMLEEKYPTVNFIYENRAIGGFQSPTLTLTSWTDLFPFYPDLLFFHVYGPIDKYEEIVKNTRKLTTAEIVLWSSHAQAHHDPKQMLAERDQRSKDIKAVAERNKCMFVDLNKKWCQMLVDGNLSPTNFLSDGCHMKESTGAYKYYAGFIGEEMCRIPGANGEPEITGTITEMPVSKSSDGSIKLTFEGNRVVAVSNGRNWGCPQNESRRPEAELFLDGRPVSSYKEMWYTTRASKLICWMPMISLVRFNTIPVREDWTLTYLEGTDKWGKPIHYKVEGSVTGYDGEGWSTNDFTSISGRAVIPSEGGLHSWQYSYFIKAHVDKKPNLMEKAAKPGDRIMWSTLPLFADPFVAQKKGETSVLVQNCSNGRHVLEIRPKDGAEIPGISKFIVYAPAKAK